MNLVILTGRLGQDAENKFTPAAKCVTKFSIATTKRWGTGDDRKEKTTWHNCIIWDREGLAQYLTKGRHVSITGEIDNYEYEDKQTGGKRYGTQIVVNEVDLGPNQDGDGGGSRGSSRGESRGSSRTASNSSRGNSRDNGRASRSSGRGTAPTYDEPEDSYGASDDDIPF